VAPNTAAEIAETYDIRVYTIGVGSRGTAPYPVNTPYGVQYKDMEVKIDEDVLQQIAQTTNGKYFRAVNNQKLKKIYEEIDKMEKSKIEVTEFSEKNEEFFWFVIIGVALIIIEITLKNTVLRSIP
jgi:Ca-activated chloride channel family protein